MGDAPLEQRKQKTRWKRRKKNVNTNLMEVVSQLKPVNLQGLLLGSAVWLCVDGQAVRMLDALCLGNLDGGAGTAAYVQQNLAAAGVALPAPAGAEEAAPGQDVPSSGGGSRGGDGAKAVRLSLEEAFFMAYALRVLTVHEAAGGSSGGGGGGSDSEQGRPSTALDDEALWQRLQAARPDFTLQYLAYHHFRSKGWIPRTGLQYGADMVLYQRHPALAHSDYSVLILPLEPRWRPAPSWHDIQVLNRLTAQVSKKLLLLYVQEECGSGRSGDYSSPKCLARFSVHERLVRRWVPDSHRPA